MATIAVAETLDPCNYVTQTPPDVCILDCGGRPYGARQYDRCGVCGGDNSTCIVTSSCPVLHCTICCGCDEEFHPVTTDPCGKCGGDGTSCMGCDGVPFSGKLIDKCGVCGGDSSSCIGCDGVIHSGKVPDLCGVCDGGNRNRDVCGVCTSNPTQFGETCSGCDSVPFRYAFIQNFLLYIDFYCVFFFAVEWLWTPAAFVEEQIFASGEMVSLQQLLRAVQMQ